MKAMMWVVYDHPKDEPEHCYVARQWVVGIKSEPTLIKHVCKGEDELNELRKEFLRIGLVRMFPSIFDDKVILETWL